MKIISELSLRYANETFQLDDDEAEAVAMSIDNSDESSVIWDLLENAFEAQHKEPIQNPIFVVSDFLTSPEVDEILDSNGFYKASYEGREFYNRADLTEESYHGQQWPCREVELPNGETHMFSIQALRDNIPDDVEGFVGSKAERMDNMFSGYCETTKELMSLTPEELAEKFDIK
ncbi:MAG: hypothetical protein J6Y37_12855 [Paludibacteraceae bacterium]|nr:hypothetical protein [Paludibacteraceae bacterium]